MHIQFNDCGHILHVQNLYIVVNKQIVDTDTQKLSHSHTDMYKQN